MPGVLNSLILRDSSILISANSALQSSIIYTFSKERLRSASFSILTITIGIGFVGGVNIGPGRALIGKANLLARARFSLKL